MTLLAIDPGTLMGWACFETEWPYERVGSGVVKLSASAKDHPGARYSRLLEFINRFSSPDGTPRIEALAYERVLAHSSTDAAHVYGGICAIVFAWAYREGLPVIECTVPQVKKRATGKGNATKQQMVDAANRTWNMGFTYTLKEVFERPPRTGTRLLNDEPLASKWVPVFVNACDNEADALWVGMLGIEKMKR